ncbi:aldolase/citrate lyase family protein [Aestuariivirga sp.]|uniref:HpcH/HpaI aldolase family protein n=1 Tax=Aestuariivirga sp. TaxID=2650926 RepID=UPI0025C0C161|nr:aldolase/citrate lyase family protein [Aestuariivirga sp.]
MGLKELARAPGPKIGNFIVEFATPGIGHILKAAGLDFAFFDMEHSGFSFETLKSAVRYFEAARVPLVVRVPAQENDMLARACDMGAEGLIAPMISTAAQAQAMVDSVKYFPDGKRGVGLQMAHDNYRAAPVADALKAANDRTAVICLIETAEGAENADAIASVNGVDGLWVGHFDLSVSLGIPGEFNHPKFTAAIDRTIKAAKKHGKFLGRLVPSADAGIAVYKDGFDFICYSGDIWVLRDGLAAAARAIREGAK